MNLEQIVNRRTDSLYSSTRSEIFMSMGAVLLFVGVIAWRLAPARDPWLELGLVALVVWVVISLYRFRHRLRAEDRARMDAAAATGVEYYRRELERRRDHLRSAWVWNGPLFLACLILGAVVKGNAFPGMERLSSVLPLMALLAAWVAFGAWRRRKQAQEIQVEIDELEPGGPSD